MTRRTRKQKLLTEGRGETKVKPKRKAKKVDDDELSYFKADLTKSLWLTMLAVGVEVTLWYLWK